MGKMKFSFPNAENIYLHDTPSKELFAKSPRTFSNGCIRLEDASRFGALADARRGSCRVVDRAGAVRQAAAGRAGLYHLSDGASSRTAGATFADDVYGRDRDAAARVASLGVQPAEGAEPGKAAP